MLRDLTCATVGAEASDEDLGVDATWTDPVALIGFFASARSGPGTWEDFLGSLETEAEPLRDRKCLVGSAAGFT